MIASHKGCGRGKGGKGRAEWAGGPENGIWSEDGDRETRS